MASFGISCCLPTRRRNQIQTDDFKKSLSSDDSIDDLALLMTPPSQKKVRRAPLSNLPTLASCGLSDSYFFGRPKWPRANRQRFGLPSGPQVEQDDADSSSSHAHHNAKLPLPAVRATRFGLTYPDQNVFERTQKAEQALSSKLRQMRFPSLNMLKPTKLERREPPLETTNGQTVNPDRRQVVVPKSFRSNMMTDMRNRQLFTDFPPLEMRSMSPVQNPMESTVKSSEGRL